MSSLRPWPAIALVAIAALPCRPAAAVESPTEPPPLPATLSLDDALRIFRAHGLDLVIAEAAVHGAEGDVGIARQIYNPNLSYSFSHVFHYDPAQVCPPDAPGGYGGSEACSPNVHALTLGDGAALSDLVSGKRGLRIAVAEAALRAARMTRADAERTLAFQVKSQYLQTVLARDQLDFALEVQAGWEQSAALGQLRYQKGAISERDAAVIDTEKLEADRTVRLARQTLRAAKIGLAFLLGVRGVLPEFDVAADLPPFAVPPRLAAASPDALLRDAIEARPDLRAQQAQIDRAEAAIRQAKRARVPDLALQIGVSYAAPAGGAFSSNTVPPTLALGVGGNLPIFYQQQGEIEKAEADLAAQRALREKTLAQIASDLATAAENHATARDLVERMEGRQLDRARRARDLTRLQYDKGAASLLEYLDAQRTFIATNGEHLQDLANYWIAVFQLEEAVGVELR